MGSLFFSYVPAEGFTSFKQALASGAWGAVDTVQWEGPDQTAAKPLGEAKMVVGHKLRLKWGIEALVLAMEGAGSAKDRDKAWDGAQKQLRALLAAAALSSDAAKREAAGRLQKSLLLGAGEAQTRLKYQQEVDFGRNQALLTSQGQAAADVALLGLGNVMAEIQSTTNALAAAIGHGNSSGRPFERLEEATAACAASFAAVAEQLEWQSQHAQPGPDREQAMSLRAPLETLVERYSAAKEKAAATPAEAPAEAPGGGSG